MNFERLLGGEVLARCRTLCLNYLACQQSLGRVRPVEI
jgi:hypothetical protein